MKRYRTLAVTGGTGFVGRHLIARATAEGYFVRALTRREQAEQESVRWIDGALERPDSLATLVTGADAVIHVAAAVSAPDRETFEKVNALGTLAVVEAALDAGIRRFVHVSSLAAREPGLSDYGWSKARSETIVAASGLDWTIVRPAAIYGPGDREMLELFKMARRGLMLLPPGGRLSVIAVEDLVRLLLAVLPDDDSWAETYEPDDGADGGWDQGDFARAIGEAVGRDPRTMAVSSRLLRIASRIDRLVRRGKAKLTLDRARYFAHPDWVSSPARRPPEALWRAEIGTGEGLRATAEHYRAEGWLKE